MGNQYSLIVLVQQLHIWHVADTILAIYPRNIGSVIYFAVSVNIDEYLHIYNKKKIPLWSSLVNCMNDHPYHSAENGEILIVIRASGSGEPESMIITLYPPGLFYACNYNISYWT